MIYFVQCNGDDGPIKIGYTRGDVQARLVAMQSSNPYELKLIGLRPGGREMERRLQQKFERFRIRGEWYRADSTIVESIRAMEGDGIIGKLNQIQAQRNWTNARLAKELGVSPAYISSLYVGRMKPGNKLLSGILQRFPELSECVFGFLTGSPPPPSSGLSRPGG